ncbi:hypothetical protein F5Y19DRAFT_232756 [Xylariaceae sp. FL1651]|nr:hypothetical protein F5Y19DRAFT_232756 [Xylariaceae sp. FL1651]
MCIYILLVPLCEHAPTLLAGPSCEYVARELSRIHSPEAWSTAKGRAILPFDWPDTCSPSEDNLTVVGTNQWCGWECRNTFDPAGLMEKTENTAGDKVGNKEHNGRRGMGLPEAEYGVERKGVGWRD